MSTLVRCYLIILIAAASIGVGFAQTGHQRDGDVFVDQGGILRWRGTNEEVRLFGVNYTTPFAYSYRAHKRLGVDMKKAIDLDVAHLARLDLDAFRVHVWDREISDEAGNLLSNEHLDLFDYLLGKLADRGFKIIVTPIAWWGNGWPESDEATRGFSQNYSKVELITNGRAREAQRNYLRQFVAHINPYRNHAYKNDPSIIALEIINEPRHPENGETTTQYINEMTAVVRDAGYVRPVFYNISENWNGIQANAVANANVDGVSFQWYPTGLVHDRMLQGNYLINVNNYAIPSGGVAGFGTKAKMVYEFDAADVGGSYMYPAMARSFREAGMQFATMFSYDPVQIAWSNTEYPTHYVNLLYAPSKAISLMIAGKAFRQLPGAKPFGAFPENSKFGDFYVDGDADVSEMNSPSEFYYSRSSHNRPKDEKLLQHVAGCGSSSVVHYDGTGAYFLDRLEQGIWRLEVYPDVLWVRDPFGRTSMSREVARLFWRERNISLVIADLGQEYTIRSLSRSDSGDCRTVVHPAHIKPGAYIVSGKAADEVRIKRFLQKERAFLAGLYTPQATVSGTYVVNKTALVRRGTGQTEFRFQIAGEHPVANAAVYFRQIGWRGFTRLPLRAAGGFDYFATDTSAITKAGRIEYCVAVEAGGTTYTFPGGSACDPNGWDFSAAGLWTLKTITSDAPLVLLDISRDRNDLVFSRATRSMKYDLGYQSGSNSEEWALSARVMFSRGDSIPFGLQLHVAEWMDMIGDVPGGDRHVNVKARSAMDSTCTIGINLLMADGRSYTASPGLTKAWREIDVPLSAFQPGTFVILPDAYPLFLPQLWKKSWAPEGKPDLRLLQSIQVVVDPAAVTEVNGKKEAGFDLVSVQLR